VTVEQRSGERRAQPAQVDAFALAEITADDDAGHALQRLGEILVRELADVFRGDGINDADRVALGLQRLANASADTGDDDLVQLLGGGVIGVSRRGRLQQSHRNGGTDQSRTTGFHGWRPFPVYVVQKTT
jgi:hypothetical protein